RTTLPGSPQQLAEESHGCEPVTFRLNENINDDTVLIHSSPQIVPHAVDIEEHLIQMPFVAGTGTLSPQACRERFAKLLAPASDRFVADQYAACGHRLFHITKA